MPLNDAFAKVAEFHAAFGHPIATHPTPLDKKRRILRAEWMKEEVQEWIDADELVNQADAIIDLIYFALGSLVEAGVKPETLFNIVHKANMSKIWPDGMVRYNSDGKVNKPPSWIGPEIELGNAVLLTNSLKSSSSIDDICLPRCLQEAAYRMSKCIIDVDEISCRLLPARESVEQAEDERVGYIPDSANITKALRDLGFPVKVEMHFAKSISELSFDKMVESFIADGAIAIGLFSHGYLFRHQRGKLGHAAIIEDLSSQEITLFDPGAINKTLRHKVKIDDFYGACRARDGGILILRADLSLSGLP